ncbi:hypothetical protein [Aliikangiella sp. G2MR2-5]|uniref:hypothetical protein n=1 Tax=Aliikangiella sp. G2MR2-5 TaxID=2788943 RepID=UPI0018AA7CC3|nr:hypothetical protein [Aliikangiella sp. G2MR2-5]
MGLNKFTIKIVAVCGLLAANSAIAGKNEFSASIELTFEKAQVCELHSANGKTKVDGKSWRKHDDKTISWSAGCEIAFPKGVKYCLLSGQAIEDTSAILSWSAVSAEGKIVAHIHSEADINPDFGKFMAAFRCY